MNARAYAAGLLASDGEADERYAATPAYDEWLELPFHAEDIARERIGEVLRLAVD